MAVRGTSLVRLAATHLEAQSIARLLPPAQVFLAEGKDATPTVALGPEVSSARYVHFATHAILDNVDPDRSGLAFSHVGGDGFVRVPEIEKSHLAAGLVVLSACRTAIGKRFDGEGLVGLTRAFLVAGVPRVVSSLWQVDDAATAELMAQFYRGLIVDKLAPAAALRRAQLDAARKAPPRLWAGFAFYGDWR
jgi:CHAT domain-containing protein